MWLNPMGSHAVQWDYSMCGDNSRGAQVRELMAKAFKGPLVPAQQQQVLAELEGRAGLDSRFVVAVVAVHVSATVAAADHDEVAAAASKLDGVVVERAEGLGEDLAGLLAAREQQPLPRSRRGAQRRREDVEEARALLGRQQLQRYPLPR